MNTTSIGRQGEDAAVKYLADRGYRILQRNFRAANGEIDIVAIRDRHLSFVEVKARKNTDFGYPSDAVNVFKQKKIINAAKAFLMRFSDYEEISFDVCEIYFEKHMINYIENAFEAE